MRLVLTIIDRSGDKTFRSFPFDPNLSGSREAAEERLQLAILKRPAGAGVLWEVKDNRRELAGV